MKNAFYSHARPSNSSQLPQWINPKHTRAVCSTCKLHPAANDIRAPLGHVNLLVFSSVGWLVGRLSSDDVCVFLWVRCCPPKSVEWSVCNFGKCIPVWSTSHTALHSEHRTLQFTTLFARAAAVELVSRTPIIHVTCYAPNAHNLIRQKTHKQNTHIKARRQQNVRCIFPHWQVKWIDKRHKTPGPTWDRGTQPKNNDTLSARTHRTCVECVQNVHIGHIVFALYLHHKRNLPLCFLQYHVCSVHTAIL